MDFGLKSYQFCQFIYKEGTSIAHSNKSNSIEFQPCLRVRLCSESQNKNLYKPLQRLLIINIKQKFSLFKEESFSVKNKTPFIVVKRPIQFVANKMGNLNYGYPVFTKEINAVAWPFLGKYRLTKVGVFQQTV